MEKDKRLMEAASSSFFFFCIYEHFYSKNLPQIASSKWCIVCLLAQSCPFLLWPHRLQPNRLLCPWDFSSKNIRVDCHFLLPMEASWWERLTEVCLYIYVCMYICIYSPLTKSFVSPFAQWYCNKNKDTKRHKNITSINSAFFWNTHLPHPGPTAALDVTGLHLLLRDGAPTWPEMVTLPRRSLVCTVYNQCGHCISWNFNEENGTDYSQWDRPTPRLWSRQASHSVHCQLFMFLFCAWYKTNIDRTPGFLALTYNVKS